MYVSDTDIVVSVQRMGFERPYPKAKMQVRRLLK